MDKNNRPWRKQHSMQSRAKGHNSIGITIFIRIARSTVGKCGGDDVVREIAARGRYQRSVRVRVQSVRANGSCRVFSVHFLPRRHPRHTICCFVHLHACFRPRFSLYNLRISRWIITVQRREVSEETLRFRTIVIDLWSTDREFRGRFVFIAGATLVEKHVD